MKYFSFIIFRSMLVRHMTLFLFTLLVTVPVYVLVSYMILSQGAGHKDMNILKAAIYLSPARILEVIPVIAGVATILWLIYAETNKHLMKTEILGSSVAKIVLAIGIVFGTLTVAFILLFQDPISELSAKGNEIINNASQDVITTSFTEEGVWIRRFEGNKISIIYAEKFSRSEKIATNISFYLMTRDHKFVQRLSAKKASLEEGYWLMQDGMEISQNNPTVFFKERKLPSQLVMTEVIGSMQKPRATSLWEIGELEHILAKNGMPSFGYSSYYYYALALPLFTVAIIFLVSLSMLFSMKKYSFVTSIAWGILTLVVVSFSIKMPYALSSTGYLPPFVGSALPALIMFAIGVALTVRQGR